MGRTKVLEFHLGDIVEHKKEGRPMLIVDKRETIKRFRDLYNYSYVGLDLTNGQSYNIFSDINNKHYRVVA